MGGKGERIGRKEREREKESVRQLDRDSQIVVHMIAIIIKQISHTHFLHEMEEEKNETFTPSSEHVTALLSISFDPEIRFGSSVVPCGL